MPAHLVCPTCGRALTVSDNAPAKLTCPNCLGKISNPLSTRNPTLPGGAIAPLRVIPVEQQVATDTRSIRYLFIALVIVVAAGAWFTVAAIGGGSGVFHLVILGIILALLVVAIVGGQRIDARAASQQAIPPPPEPRITPGQLPGQPPVLPYRAYRATGTPQPPTNPLAAVGGFFAAVGVCGAGFFALAATVDSAKGYHPLILLAVVSAVLAFIFTTPFFAERPGWRGYGRGVTIGLSLGLLALGPCAFCYTMTFS